MKNYSAINKKWWNGVTSVHASSKLYDLPRFKKGKTSLQKTELKELGNVKGKTLLHLMCHFGMDTLSWAREGAEVTGVDISDTAIQLARELSTEVNVPGTFICSDIYELPNVLNTKFDIIFASYGVLLWLSNIKKFAEILKHFLNDGGIFYIVELHPFTNILSYDMDLFYKYFDHGPYMDDSPGTYADWNNKNVKGTTYQWNYTMSDIINSLLSTGLKIEYIHEFPYTMYDQFPGFMKKLKTGEYILKNKDFQIPLLFSLKAIK